MFKITALAVLVLLLVAVLGQSQRCEDLEATEGFVYRHQDDNHIVYPIVNCKDDYLRIQIRHNYSGEDLSADRIIQLFYECTDVYGNVTIGEPSDSRNYQLDNRRYNVSLPPAFTAPGASCLVYGCYQPILYDLFIYPIQNRTCTYEESSLATSDSLSMTTISPTNLPSPLTTTVDINLASVFLLAGVTTLSTDSSSLATLAATVAPNGTLVSTLPDGSSELTGQALIITAAVVMAMAVVLIVAVSLAAFIKAHRNQRRKLHILRYYNYSEPIDPFFNPVDIRAKIKNIISLESVFDTLIPNQSDNDGKSKVLGAHIHLNHTAETMLVGSMVFCDEEQASSSESDTNKTDQEETKNVTEEPAAAGPTPEPPTQTPVKNGYVPNRFINTDFMTGLKSVPNGYVVDKSHPSAMPMYTAQSQSGNNSAEWNDDLTCDISTSSSWNGVEPAQPLVLSPVSNGYVSDLSTPLDHPRQPPKIDSNGGVASMKPLPKPKYSILENGYTVVESQLYVGMETKPHDEDSNSAVYSIDEDVSMGSDCRSLMGDCEGVESVTSECEGVANVEGHENIVTECSLSLNPLHFEPVDDPTPEQTVPVYVNTLAEDQFLQSSLQVQAN